MRLRTLYEKIEIELPHIQGIAIAMVPGGNNFRKIERYGESIKCIRNLSALIYIEDIIQKLDKKGLFRMGTSVTMDVEDANYYISALNNVIGRCETIKSLINDHVPEDDNKSIIVKLPGYQNYSAFANTQSELAKCFKLIDVLPDLKKEPNISNFDVGSDWIRIIFETLSAAANFATVITAVVQFNKSRIDKRLGELELLNLQTDSETDKKIRDAINKDTLEAYTALSNEITNKIQSDNLDPEDTLKLIKGLQGLVTILNSGVSFHAPITHDEQNPFTLPTKEEQNSLPESGQSSANKLIGNINNDKK
ncbi:hypothetical protein [Lactiplantibacillus plantarum]|uniref:hypothetical protein n=1 Tax=Lactiplantibacillus plantarum TaxID=1590 RepID=UPI000CF8EF67|nr:hypothetical protein [Lactiplantibacillus plantarum]SPD90193.1 hypothetical protein LAP8962_00693 [Lactiplantibacillus plantarum]VFI61219.1 hypothetical protein LAP9434_00691 [Lactiplantibacillus plantarum]VFQ55770.1 hypothetical protein LAP9435_0691 [Lactiplantibacillus plantarum]